MNGTARQDEAAGAGWTEAELAEARRYAVVIEWSPEDGAYVATVPEFVGCLTHGATQEEALAMAVDAAATNIMAERVAGRPVPSPRFFRFAEADAVVPA